MSHVNGMTKVQNLQNKKTKNNGIFLKEVHEVQCNNVIDKTNDHGDVDTKTGPI